MLGFIGYVLWLRVKPYFILETAHLFFHSRKKWTFCVRWRRTVGIISPEGLVAASLDNSKNGSGQRSPWIHFVHGIRAQERGQARSRWMAALCSPALGAFRSTALWIGSNDPWVPFRSAPKCWTRAGLWWRVFESDVSTLQSHTHRPECVGVSAVETTHHQRHN